MQGERAMAKEMVSFHKNQAKELVDKLIRASIIDYKWIYKIEDGISRSHQLKYKARLLVKGYTQKG